MSKRFEEYHTARSTMCIHPDLTRILSETKHTDHLIFYGRKRVGKYYLALDAIKPHSPLELRYEKIMKFVHNKKQHIITISDVHFEIDLATLCSNARTIWHTLYITICDIIASRREKYGIILFKNFHEISIELFDMFYSYINDITIKFTIQYILIAEHISFMPDHFLDKFSIVRVPVPNESVLELMRSSTPDSRWSQPTTVLEKAPYERIIIDNVLNHMVNFNPKKTIAMRNSLYDVHIYSLYSHDVVWVILTQFLCKFNNVPRVLVDYARMMSQYVNNYRPIIHLERLIMYFVKELLETNSI